jgi:WD40 repeat protein
MFAATPDGTETGKPEPVSVLAYSPDGRILAVAGGTTVRLWDAASHPLGAALLTAGDTIKSLTFSSDGTTLTVTGAHAPPSTYPIAPDLVATAVCRRSSGGLPRSTWHAYIPQVPYRDTC